MKRYKRLAAISMAAIGAIGQAVQADPTLTTLATFTGTANGASPDAGLIADSNGNLYGTTSAGGTYSDGTVFELSGVNHQTLTTLYNFNGSSGAKPLGALTIDSSGNLYGTTETGGANNQGTAFELPVSSPATLNTLVSFNSSSGTQPFAGLTIDASGNLYGTTAGGGASNDGTVFALSGANHSTFSLLTTFNGSNGSVPYGGLVFDAAGNLYGTTAAGGANGGNGTVFRLSGINHTTLTTLVSFNGSDGSLAEESLSFGPDGNLYGTTALGGTYGEGNAFRLSGTNFATITNLVSFNGSNGAFPYATLIADAAGNLFGTTQNGGTPNNGTIFELSGTNYQTLTQIEILDGTIGAPRGALLNDSSGSLYATASTSRAGSGAGFQLSGSGFVIVMPAVTVTMGTAFHLTAPTGTNLVLALNGIRLGSGSSLVVDAAGSKHPRVVDDHHDLALSSGSTVNLENNDLDFSSSNTGSGGITIQGMPTSTDLTSATSAVAMAYNQGNWNGSTGIESSNAAADTTHLTAVGVIQNNQSGSAIYSSSNLFDGIVPGPGDILFKYTYYGDANLDGKVDGSDYSLIDTGFLSQGTSTGWYYGDFNYDGIVDGSDYTLIDNTFNTQGAALTASLDALPTTALGTTGTSVPEPDSVLAIPVAAMAMLGRRPLRKRSFAHIVLS